MPEQERETVDTMSETRLKELHLYKELLGKDERRDRYTVLRLSGASRGQANRWKDWSPNHYEQMLEYLCNPALLAGRLEYNRLSLSEEGLKSLAVA